MSCTVERIQRRNFKVLPLIYGNKLCMRDDCLYLLANVHKKLIVAKKSKAIFISAPITIYLRPQDCIIPLSRSVACRGREVKCDEAWYILCVNTETKQTKAFVYAM